MHDAEYEKCWAEGCRGQDVTGAGFKVQGIQDARAAASRV